MNMSGRLALLSIIFILLAEIAVLVPSLAFYRLNRLQERIDDAALVAEALLTTPNPQIDADQSEALLSSADVLDIAIIKDDRRELLLIPRQELEITQVINMTELTSMQQLTGASVCFNQPDNNILRLIGQPFKYPFLIETTLKTKPLCDDVVSFAGQLLFISLVVSLIAGGILYFAVNRIIVAPLLYVTKSITAFQGKRIERNNLIEERSKIREIRDAESSLRTMQLRILSALAQKERLANVGESVAKIQHDLRNMLATAHMIADNLEKSRDPAVRKTAPRLVRAIDRAIELSSETLEYGRVGERKPRLETIELIASLTDLVEEERFLNKARNVKIEVNCAPKLKAFGDAEFMRRVIQNLVRNARQILEEQGGGKITVSARYQGERAAIMVEDNGPGMSKAALEGLFHPFKGSTRAGGTGLGLAISKELCILMDGDLELLLSDDNGTSFVLYLPIKG